MSGLQTLRTHPHKWELILITSVVVVAATGVILVLRKLILNFNSNVNRDDCADIGARLHGTATLHVMPNGVRDVCIVKTNNGETIVVQMR